MTSLVLWGNYRPEVCHFYLITPSNWQDLNNLKKMLILNDGVSFVFWTWSTGKMANEPHRDKTNKIACVPSEDSDQPGHPPGLIRVFAVRSMGSWGSKLSSCGQWRLWSDWADVPRLIWVFAGRTAVLLVLSCRGSFVSVKFTCLPTMKFLLSKTENCYLMAIISFPSKTNNIFSYKASLVCERM